MIELTDRLDEELLGDWVRIEETLRSLRDSLGQLEQEISRRLTERGAKEMLHPYVSCRLIFPTPGIDPTKLTPLREILPPDTLGEGFFPAHEEIVQAPDRWDMRVVNKWARSLGNEVASIVEGAKFPGAPRLVIKAK